MFQGYPKDRSCQRIECQHYQTLIIGSRDLTLPAYVKLDEVQCALQACIYKDEPSELFPEHNPELLNILTREEVEALLV